MTDNHDIDEAFDLLHELADLSFEDRAKFYSPENVDHLNKLSIDLLPDEASQEIKNLEEFVQMSQRLTEQEAYWSKSLGQAILDAADCRDSGDAIAAIQILDEFIAHCSSTSYREIAMTEKQNYESGES